ncbi:MAG: FKBP-type peptidyl-prolyl cis-trans isomerase [Bacteroidota bacterium]|nr:FKBP-type peptidyl-prolyl cis-trans isomerase [Bacteroidota bacterium]
MVIEKNKFVSLTYELRANEKNSEIVEQVNADRPMEFLFGNGQMLPAFEEKLAGLACGDKFDFMLKPKEGYGEIDERAIVNINKDIFASNGEEHNDLLVVGNSIPMRDSNGNRMDGKVMEITENTVKMDFNHPMAGNTLFFTGEVVDLREASEHEIDQGCSTDSEGCSSCSGCG